MLPAGWNLFLWSGMCMRSIPLLANTISPQLLCWFLETMHRQCYYYILLWVDLDWLPCAHQAALSLHLFNKMGRKYNEKNHGSRGRSGGSFSSYHHGKKWLDLRKIIYCQLITEKESKKQRQNENTFTTSSQAQIHSLSPDPSYLLSLKQQWGVGNVVDVSTYSLPLLTPHVLPQLHHGHNSAGCSSCQQPTPMLFLHRLLSEHIHLLQHVALHGMQHGYCCCCLKHLLPLSLYWPLWL